MAGALFLPPDLHLWAPAKPRPRGLLRRPPLQWGATVRAYAKAIALIGISAFSGPAESDPDRAYLSETRSGSVTVAEAPSASYPRSDLEAAAPVLRKNWEPRPDNARFNHTVPTPDQLRQIQVPTYMDARGHAALRAVTGDFTGTTDEIFQWGAYKWGFDPDLVRANAVNETYWRRNFIGDIGNGVSWESCRSSHDTIRGHVLNLRIFHPLSTNQQALYPAVSDR